MAGTMYPYLPILSTADYTAETMVLPPSEWIHEEGGKRINENEALDGSAEYILLAANPVFYITLGFKNLYPSECDTILSLYFDAAKGNCGLNSMLWQHPLDSHTYVVRFSGKLKWSGFGNARTISAIKLRVEGRYVY